MGLAWEWKMKITDNRGVVDVEHPIPQCYKYYQAFEDAQEASGRCGYAFQDRNRRPDLKGMRSPSQFGSPAPMHGLRISIQYVICSIFRP
jgi:hypothetical protein